MKYELTFVCEKDGDREELGYDVEFFYNPEQYGNGTFMSCENHKKGYADYYFDIRYERDYCVDEQKQFILNWALNTWSGKNGSWPITSITLKEVGE